MVAEGYDVTLVALEMHLLEVGTLGQRMFAVTHAVTLEVGLGSKVDAVLVAEVVPARVVRIVAGAYGVNVELLHDFDVLNHAVC